MVPTELVSPRAVNRFIRLGQTVTLEAVYSAADRLRKPFVMRLGGWGIDGVDSRVRIHDRTDLRRLGPDLAGERPAHLS